MFRADQSSFVKCGWPKSKMCIHTGKTPVEGSVPFKPNQRIRGLIGASEISCLLTEMCLCRVRPGETLSQQGGWGEIIPWRRLFKMVVVSLLAQQAQTPHRGTDARTTMELLGHC